MRCVYLAPQYSLFALRLSAARAADTLDLTAVSIGEMLGQMKGFEDVPADWFSPADLVTDYLRQGFGSIVDVFEHLKRVDPDEEVRKLGERIAAILRRIYEVIREWTKGRHYRYFQQQSALVMDLMSPGYFVNHVVSIRFNRISPELFRKMVMDRIVSGLWHLFEIVRDALRCVELKLRRSPSPIKVGEYAKPFVYLADIQASLLVLILQDGRKESFNVSSPAVWSCIRRLLETNRQDGRVSLPKGFRGALVTKDKNGNQVQDDLWRLSLHIHSAQNGEYYLSPRTRTPLKWDR